MRTIRIQEAAIEGDAFAASVTFDGGSTYPIRVTNPFTPEQEKNLEWYFEEHLRFPFADDVKARKAGESVSEYGRALFSQVFADTHALIAWSGLRSDLRDVRFEIIGSAKFHALHWEALSDPDFPLPIATQSQIIRHGTKPVSYLAALPESPTVNILLISARIYGERDFNYRTVSRPLVDALSQAKVRARVDIVRPGTYQALLAHLDAARGKPAPERYHVVHFDMHGAVYTTDRLKKAITVQSDANRGMSVAKKFVTFAGEKPFLFFAGDKDGEADPRDADELTKRLTQYGIPIVVLDACQSGREVGPSEASLACRVLDAGVQVVIAMSYSVTVSAAKLFMTEMYRKLLDGADISQAVVAARRETELRKNRKAYFNQTIQLEDWVLPVVYQHKDVSLATRQLTPEEEEKFYQRESARYVGASPEFGFFGRDLDILNIENRLLTRSDNNILLVRGMGGAGKSTLLKYLAAWWQRTGLIEEVFYFGYDEKAYARQQILWVIAKRLFGKYKFTTFESSSPDIQQTMVASELQKTRHLVILDNIESITGERLSIPNTLTEREQKELHSFLHTIRGGQSLVLLGSRSGEKWLASGTFEANVCELGGLDPEAASNLADRILEARGAKKFKANKDLARLIKLLAGFPLALEVVLGNLPVKSPTAILEELTAGDLDLNTGDANDKTKSIVACIAYSYSNLSEESQSLLLCLAPFSGVFNSMFLDAFTEALRSQPLLTRLNFKRWSDVLSEAQSMGLMTPETPGSPILRLQPVLPYFLRTRIRDSSKDGRHEAIEAAFREHYRNLAEGLLGSINSNEPDKRQLALALTTLEEENLRKAVLDGATAGEDFKSPIRVLSDRTDVTQDNESMLALASSVIHRLSIRKDAGQDVPPIFMAIALDEVGWRSWKLQRYEQAKSIYQQKLAVEAEQPDDPIMCLNRAGTLHQLGVIAQQQHQWSEAQSYYEQALAIQSEYDDRKGQAPTLHQLGIVASEQRHWPEAESYYKRALALKIEFTNRYAQAHTLHQLGILAQHQRQWSEAESYYKQSLEIYTEFLDRSAQAGTLHQLGRVAEERSQWPEAESYYKQALAIFVEFSDRPGQSKALHQLGIVAEEQHQWPEAESYYKKALEIKVELDDRYSQASTLHQLGKVAEEQHQWLKAESHYQEALAIYTEFGDRYEQAETLHQLGSIAEDQQWWSEAKNYYQKALRIYSESNDDYNFGIVVRSLARLWRVSGDELVIDETAKVLAIEKDEVRARFEVLLDS